MKKARVSAVYEGRIGKRSKEENENDSRIARMHARARKNGLRAKKNRCFVVTERRRKARSNTKRKVEASPNKEACMLKDQGKTLDNVEAVEIIDDEPILDVAVILDSETVHQMVAETMRGEVIVEENEGPAWWEEYWPVSYRTNENQAMEVLVKGFVGGMTEEELWWDDIWNFRDMDDHFPKAHRARERI
ncbi:hypothetical protein POPTR_004G099900v4 [Populus trichocarpa]|jgi:hypothetical protein|uniref:Uncharacterized protein n=1 Tax=Populus trichocarpa TaxID=3694 RepID=B9H2Z5_POPTR|nr:hypothetical protein BDE02_04G086400 [Populus trichocarpa]PNT40470.1 hypothetical protein POPTR_004G099900v4 [Populus trichocarpa]